MAVDGASQAVCAADNEQKHDWIKNKKISHHVFLWQVWTCFFLYQQKETRR